MYQESQKQLNEAKQAVVHSDATEKVRKEILASISDKDK